MPRQLPEQIESWIAKHSVNPSLNYRDTPHVAVDDLRPFLHSLLAPQPKPQQECVCSLRGSVKLCGKRYNNWVTGSEKYCLNTTEDGGQCAHDRACHGEGVK